MSADKSELNARHEALAAQMTEKLRGGDATAPDLDVIRQFLKDNGVTADAPSGRAASFGVVRCSFCFVCLCLIIFICFYCATIYTPQDTSATT